MSALSRDLETATESGRGLLSNALELERDAPARRPLEALEPEEAAALAALSAKNAAFATPRVTSAFRVAAAAHRGDAALLAHCAETALEVAELGMREEVVAAAMTTLSFDARYSTFAPEEAERLVGVDVARLVRGARKLADVSDVSRASVRPISDDERARLRAMLLAATDARAVTIELASRLVRVRRDDASTELAEETAATHVPLASRLGVWSLKARLEDACLAKTQPEAHARLSAALDADEQRAAIDAAIERIGASLADAGVSFEEMYGRRKSLASTHRKMAKKGRERVEEVHDARAIRVIVEDENACYAALRATLSTPGFEPVEGKTKDYVQRRQAQRIPIPARRRSRRRRARVRGANSHPRDARRGGVRPGGALEVQGVERGVHVARRRRPTGGVGAIRAELAGTASRRRVPRRGAIRTRTVRHRGGARGGVRDALRAVPVPVPLPDARPGVSQPRGERALRPSARRRARRVDVGLAARQRRLGESLQGDTRGTTPEIYRWCPGAGVRRGGGGRPRPRPRTPRGCETERRRRGGARRG